MVGLETPNYVLAFIFEDQPAEAWGQGSGFAGGGQAQSRAARAWAGAAGRWLSHALARAGRELAPARVERAREARSCWGASPAGGVAKGARVVAAPVGRPERPSRLAAKLAGAVAKRAGPRGKPAGPWAKLAAPG